MEGPSGSKKFTGTALGAMPDAPSEVALGPAFSIWLINGMAPLHDGVTILGCHPCLDQGKMHDLYSTMVAITVVPVSSIADAGVPPTRRLGSGRLFFPGEVQYGNFACVAGVDGWLYLFGSDNTGFKLARTAMTMEDGSIDGLADRRSYEYYHGGGKWVKAELLKKDDANGNILDWSINPMGDKQMGPDTGDVFYSPYHKTLMMVFMSQFVDGQFWASYAVENRIEGPWSKPVMIFESPVPKECQREDFGWNYQGHAHPGWDPSGRTLLLSYSSCARFVSMAKVTWA